MYDPRLSQDMPVFLPKRIFLTQFLAAFELEYRDYGAMSKAQKARDPAARTLTISAMVRESEAAQPRTGHQRNGYGCQIQYPVPVQCHHQAETAVGML
jgi:hypothetical protein